MTETGAGTGTAPGRATEAGVEAGAGPQAGAGPEAAAANGDRSGASAPASAETVDYHSLNAQLNLKGPDGRIQFGADKLAVDAYLAEHVAPRLRRFESTAAKLAALTEEGYLEAEVLAAYEPAFLDQIFAHAHQIGFEFGSFLGATKFHTSYALKSFDGSQYLETIEDRMAMVALTLARGDADFALRLLDEMLTRRFQPATPTFLNAGKAQRGEPVSCFLLRVEDNMESIARGINSALQLSKRGGGVALLLSNLRENGAPIKRIENQSSGVIPVMKLLEDSFSYANQLGARQGAGAVYLHA
ncbi:MAG: hypothetical protein LBO20_09935, partial [Bifidobacteriaceae bacterium]|nr:hypothetical protein [Bifidobacteriaceae bacterium]